MSADFYAWLVAACLALIIGTIWWLLEKDDHGHFL